jgi:hypothetical protein
VWSIDGLLVVHWYNILTIFGILLMAMDQYKIHLFSMDQSICQPWLINLSKKKVQLVTRKRNLEKPMGDKLIKKPKIISTPEKAQNKQTFFPYQK